MLDITQVRDIAEEVVRARLGTQLVEDVYAEPATDWTGDDALDVWVVIRPHEMREITKERKLGPTLIALSDRLVELGDMRFPFIAYMTRAEHQAKTRAKSKS